MKKLRKLSDSDMATIDLNKYKLDAAGLEKYRLPSGKTPVASTSGFGTTARQAGMEFRQRAEQFAGFTEQGKQTVPEQVLQTAGAMGTGLVKAGVGTVGEIPGATQVVGALSTAGKYLTGGGQVTELAKAVAPNWLKKADETVSGVEGSIKSQWLKLADDLNQNNPRLARNLLGLLEYGASAVAIASAKDLVPKIAEQTVGAVETAGKTAGSLSEKVKATQVAVKEAMTPKTIERVLSTPESGVAKLNKAERDVWFKNQESQIASKSESINAKIQQELQTKSDAGIKQAEDLQKELNVTARDKVLDLRPKIIRSMGEQSKTYRSLVDEAMAGKENTIVDKGRLKDYVDSRFGEDPGRASQIKERLRLTEQVDPLSAKGPSASIRTPKTTLGNLYEQAKSLRGTVSKSATKVFSADDKMTDDAVHTLLSYMKENGVDLKEANDFWAKYAPVRDQLVSEAKPFLQVGIKTEKLASTLTKVAQGTDVNNEIFIKETEKLLGEPITKEVKEVISKLDKNKKAAIADKIRAAEQQIKNEMATEKNLAKLTTNRLNLEQQLRFNARIKKILLGAIKLGAGAVGAGGVYQGYKTLRP